MLSGLHRGTLLTKAILKKKEKKILDEPLQDEAAQSTPAAWPYQRDFEFNFRFNSGQCFHLMDTFLCRFPQHLQLLCMWGYASSVMDGLPRWASPLRQGDFKPFCSFLGQQKETFLSLVNHNLSLLSWCKPDLQSIDSGHGVTFDINASVTKA